MPMHALAQRPTLRRLLRGLDPRTRDVERDFEAFRGQESTLILLNLCLISSLVIVHLGFLGTLGMPATWVFMLFGARFVMQTAELILLRAVSNPWSTPRIRLYEHAAITVHLAFAADVSLLSRGEDTHYTVLVVLPVVAGAFRYRLSGALVVAAIGGAISLLDVWFGGAGQSLSEYFEAFTMGLVFLLVTVVVHALVRQLEGEQKRRHEAMEELSKTREHLDREEKMADIGRLASAVAHEIRNPIAMITSSLSAAAENEDDAALQREMFDIAGTEAMRLERFTGDFLAYARTAPPQREAVHPDATLRYVADLVRAQAQRDGVTITVGCTDHRPFQADPYQVHQALLNLVKNAIEATPQEGTVGLSCTRENGAISLHIENEGAPLPESTRARLFQPFFTTKNGGTGLGLAISQNIAQAHGGSLTLSENSPNRVRFTLSMPVVDSDASTGEH